jgi:hypothetical protein
MGKEVWIERTDFEEVPPKGFFRLFPGNKVRLKYGLRHRVHRLHADADGSVTEVQATLVPDTKSGTPGADAVKVKGVITWVAWPMASRRGAPVRPPVHRAAARRGRARTSWPPEPGQPEGGHGWSSSLRWRRPGPMTSSSSSATATSWPTGSTTNPASPCSTRSPA